LSAHIGHVFTSQTPSYTQRPFVIHQMKHLII
jgi:hypothetical protein